MLHEEITSLALNYSFVNRPDRNGAVGYPRTQFRWEVNPNKPISVFLVSGNTVWIKVLLKTLKALSLSTFELKSCFIITLHYPVYVWLSKSEILESWHKVQTSLVFLRFRWEIGEILRDLRSYFNTSFIISFPPVSEYFGVELFKIVDVPKSLSPKLNNLDIVILNMLLQLYHLHS